LEVPNRGPKHSGFATDLAHRSPRYHWSPASGTACRFSLAQAFRQLQPNLGNWLID
jgi:hypothetical protein